MDINKEEFDKAVEVYQMWRKAIEVNDFKKARELEAQYENLNDPVTAEQLRFVVEQLEKKNHLKKTIITH